MVQIIFISKGFVISQVQEAIGGAKESGQSFRIVSLDSETKKELSTRGVDFRQISSYCDQDFWKNVDEKAISWIKDWPNQKIFDGRSIKEKFTYGDCSLWWFGRDSLFSAAGGLFDQVCSVELFLKIIKEERCSAAYLFGFKNAKLDLFKAVGVQQKIDLYDQTIDAPKKALASNSFARLRFFIRVFEIFYRKLAFFIHSILCLLVFDNKAFKKRVLILPHHGGYSRKYVSCQKEYVGDFYYKGIEETLRSQKNLDLLVLSPEIPKIGKFPRLSDFLEIIKGSSYRPIERHVEILNYVKRFYFKFYYTKKWSKICDSEDFRKSLFYQELDLYPFLEKYLKELFIGSFSRAIGLLNIADSILKKEKPDIILTIYETSTDRRAIEIAARKYNVPVFGLQHGAMSSFSSGRVASCHNLGDTWYSGKEDKLQCPIPIKTLVFGEYFKNLLVESGYPQETIVVAGCPRFDYLIAEDGKSIEKLKELGIDPSKKTILFLSTSLGDDSLFYETEDVSRMNKQIARDILIAIPEDWQLVIKVHPRDKENEYDFLLQEYSEKKIKILKKGDLSVLLRGSEIAVMKASTSGIEASFTKTPFIDLNLFNEPDYTPYYSQKGVARKSEGNHSLEVLIKELIANPDLREGLTRNMDGFIKEFAFAHDGKSSLRVKDEILKELSI